MKLERLSRKAVKQAENPPKVVTTSGDGLKVKSGIRGGTYVNAG